MGNTNVLLDSKAQEIMKNVYHLGQGGGSLKLATVYYTGTEDYSYASSLTLLIDTSISTPTTYEELVNYLKELGFTSDDKVYPCSGIFNDDGFAGVITGITSEQNYSEEEPVEMLKVYGIVSNSAKYTFINNSEEFSITYLGQEQGE